MAKGRPRKVPPAKPGPTIRRERPVLQGTPMRGRVTRLMLGQRHGFLRTEDRRDVFFYHSDVEDGFDRLAVGDEVEFDMFDDAVSGPRALRLRKMTGGHSGADR